MTEDVPLYTGILLQGTQGFNVSGNTIFSNNINFYEHGDVLSEGKETVVANNVSHKDKPYQSPDAVGSTYQSFVAQLTEKFIGELT